MGINLVATLILPLNFVRLGPTKVGNNIQKQKVTALRQLACLRVGGGGGGGGTKKLATWHASSRRHVINHIQLILIILSYLQSDTHVITRMS